MTGVNLPVDGGRGEVLSKSQAAFFVFNLIKICNEILQYLLPFRCDVPSLIKVCKGA